MLFALTLPAVIGFFLLAMERLEARVFGSYDPRTPRSPGTAPPPVARPVGPSGAPGARHNGNEADIDRQGPGRPTGESGPWTHR
jgi:hypothetical protein